MASLSIGLVGLPNAGKSTLFNALTKNQALVANYPFATINPNVGIVPVPDPRLARLAEIYHPTKITPATVTFVDIAGLVRGAHQGQGLGNQFLSHIRESNAICQVVRAFDDPNIAHVDGRPDPARDIETIETELILADLQTLENRLAKLEQEMKKDPAAKKALKAVKEVQQILDSGDVPYGRVDPALVLQDDGLKSLFTFKPMIYVFNVDEKALIDESKQNQLLKLSRGRPAVCLCARLEAEMAGLPESELAELLAELGQKQSGLAQLARLAYQTLNLQIFLTAGPKEVRAWTIRRGSTAPAAAGVIHSDFEKGFIRAEVVKFDDLISTGSLAGARAAGHVRSEGRDYIMAEGDVVEFRFNV